MQRLLDKLNNKFELNPAASLLALDKAEAFFNVALPKDYKQFLIYANGLEGTAKDGYIVLWSAEEIVSLNVAYNVSEFVADIVIFGSNGAEDAFAFDKKNWSIVVLPFIGMGHIATQKVADSFTEFLSAQIPAGEGFFRRFFK